jgi:antitoxin ParD1/3/4
MTRLSISLASQNDEWLKQQVLKEEFSSKSEAVNFFIKQARTQEEYYDFVRNKIEKAEKSGYAKAQTRAEMLDEFKKNLPNV